MRGGEADEAIPIPLCAHNSMVARRLEELGRRFATPAKLKLDAQEVSVAGPASAYDRIIAHGPYRPIASSRTAHIVMAALGAAIHVFRCCEQESRGWPACAGHDGMGHPQQYLG